MVNSRLRLFLDQAWGAGRTPPVNGLRQPFVSAES